MPSYLLPSIHSTIALRARERERERVIRSKRLRIEGFDKDFGGFNNSILVKIELEVLGLLQTSIFVYPFPSLIEQFPVGWKSQIFGDSLDAWSLFGVLGMRLDGEKIKEIDDEGVIETEKEMNSVFNSDSLSSTLGFSQQVVVGYALTTKKKHSFLQPKLESIARNKGILFVPIDQNRPLSDQGPFDVLLHKLLGNEWSQLLEDYRLKHPDVTVLDPPYAIQCVHNRQSMLEDVAALNLADSYGRVCIPKQLVVKKDASSIPNEVAKAGLKLPLVAKPLFVDGSAKSHELFLAYDEVSLSKLEPPLVLQEFVNHGGVMFKVYVVGDTIKVVRRFSLPDVCKRELSKYAGVFQFPRVSGAAATAEEADLDPGVAELPPRPLLETLVRELRSRMGLRLFNIDMIREHGTRDMFYVIDINYFPGYGKMPEYEHIFTDFLLRLVDAKYRNHPLT